MGSTRRSHLPPRLSLPLPLLFLSPLPQDGFPGLGLGVDGQLGRLGRDEPPPERGRICLFIYFQRRGCSVEKGMSKKAEKKGTNASFRSKAAGALLLCFPQLLCQCRRSTRPATFAQEMGGRNAPKKRKGKRRRARISLFRRLAAAPERDRSYERHSSPSSVSCRSRCSRYSQSLPARA